MGNKPNCSILGAIEGATMIAACDKVMTF